MAKLVVQIPEGLGLSEEQTRQLREKFASQVVECLAAKTGEIAAAAKAKANTRFPRSLAKIEILPCCPIRRDATSRDAIKSKEMKKNPQTQFSKKSRLLRISPAGAILSNRKPNRKSSGIKKILP